MLGGANTRTAVPRSEPAPLVRPGKGLFRLLGEVLAEGGPGYLQFAITNICNAKCAFCGFATDQLDPRQRHSVTIEEARQVEYGS